MGDSEDSDVKMNGASFLFFYGTESYQTHEMTTTMSTARTVTKAEMRTVAVMAGCRINTGNNNANADHEQR
jgi:hypothetical protein